MGQDIYDKMSAKIMLQGSKIIPQLFKMITDEQEADLLMAMPGTPEQLAEKLGRPADEVEAMCTTVYQKGLAFKSFKGGTVGYKMCRDMVQFHDATILWPEATREYHDLWQKFMEDEWPNYARMLTKILKKPFTRVIPVQESLDAGRQQILAFESVKDIIDGAEKIAVTKCTCRLIAHKCDAPLEVCLQVGNAARYTIDRGSGREVGKEEAMQIIKEAEDAGLVHVTMNKAHVGHFICNCCSCCCQTFPLLISEGLTLCDPSRFQAQVSAEICTGCGTCETTCYFNAVDMYEEDGEPKARIIAEKCMGCGLCQVSCPDEAISLIEVRPPEFVPQ